MEDEQIEQAIARLSEVHAMLVEGIDRGVIMMPRLQRFCQNHSSEQPFYRFLLVIEESQARALQGYAFGAKNLDEFVAGDRDKAHFSDHHITPEELAQETSFAERLKRMGDGLFPRMARIYSFQIKSIRERGRPTPDVAGLLRAGGLHILDIPLHFHLEQTTIAEFLQSKVLEPHQADIDMAARVKGGPQNRDDAADKLEAIRIIQEIHERYSTKTALENAPELAAFKRKYPGRHTLSDWITEALPGREFKRGRQPAKK